uniref:UBA domain-containing protein n=1 Tax=Steinernema glaseri TaxID=37863 RepID=A0A1I7Z0A3_9BILA
MVRNPNMFQEMMRNHDQAIRNLQGIPGGEAALQRLYRDLQEPLLNSATNSLAGNPFASLVDNNSATSRSQRAGVENAEALPNPWGAGSPNSASTPGAASGTSATPAGATASIMNSPGIQDLMRQMMSNPESLQSMMRNPAVQGIANSLRQNPEELREILGQSMEMFARPEIRDQVRQAFPNVFDQLTQAPPEVLGSFANPRVQEALRDIQRGYTVLREEAPELFTFASRATAAATGTGGNAEAGAANPAALGDIFRNMLNLNEASSGNAANLPPPQERFRQQLDDLQQMGFDNEAANIQALIASLGDVSGAIEFLLNRAGGQ